MKNLPRRSFIALGSAAGLCALIPRAHALTPATKMEHLAAEVEAGDFATAVERLELGIAQFPLDREVRTCLAVAQFGAQMFAQSEENLAKIIKLERGFAGRPGKLEIDYKEAWFHIAQLRVGRKPVPRSPQADVSLLSVIAGARSPRDFAEEAESRRRDALKQLAESLQDSSRTINTGTGDITVEFVVDQDSDLEPNYRCVANFMRAEVTLGTGARAEAKSWLKAALDTNASGVVEYHIAKAELARLG